MKEGAFLEDILSWTWRSLCKDIVIYHGSFALQPYTQRKLSLWDPAKLSLMVLVRILIHYSFRTIIIESIAYSRSSLIVSIMIIFSPSMLGISRLLVMML